MAKKKAPRKPNATYRLRKAHTKTVKRILALDPGSRNMGIACIGITRSSKVVVLANSIMTNPITSLVEDLNQSIETFLAEVDRWVRMYKPDGFIMERFQSRGGMGPLIELVSGMILSLCTEYRHKPCKLITAATWKNQFHRKFTDVELNDIYKQCRTTPHQLDAVLIGVFGLIAGTRQEIDYDFEDVVAQTELSSALPLRRIRGEAK